MAEKKIYVLTVSEFFPKNHPKEGLPTGFINAISSYKKIHTIRANYELWAKRAEKINKGEAVLSVRYWTGKPYNSKQREVFVLNEMEDLTLQEIADRTGESIKTIISRKRYAVAHLREKLQNMYDEY